MSAETANVILGAGIALAGVLIANAVLLLKAFVERRWQKEDRRRDRDAEVLDRRCDQIEQYIEAVTQDFRLVTNDAEYYLEEADVAAARRRMKKRKQWKDGLDTRIFAKGPAITSLNDDQLASLFSQALDLYDSLGEIYGRIYELKFDQGLEIDPSDYSGQLNSVWLEFSGVVSKMYSRINEIRKTVEE